MEPINLTQLLQAVITVIFGVITRYAIPWVQEKTTEKQRANLKMIVKTLVSAAEQLFKGSGRGAEKLAYVQDELKKLGLEVDLHMIEATVHELKKQLLV